MNWQKKFTKPFAEVLPGRFALFSALALSTVLVVGCGLLSPAKEVKPPLTTPPVVAQPAAVPVPAEVPIVVKLSAPVTSRNWAEVRLQAAHRLVAASPTRSYMKASPPILMAIPILTIELNADGSVRRIEVMRYPSQARDTVQLAIQAVHRAAPFGNVSKLPKPWKFNETFLFNEQRQFKPMTLDRL